ncbi:hypothetical protein M407DRAFT_241148 [Tulasnella calospora MUT 4182]|uniref:Uncharacterized protein n=1 Tax=Tulasnella calospora MUT 4182 TaxID=1051891 RepID=A0A0C3QW75_9AGAM|nr:hypothetical protein M407DRAFT_241148 [Tulasnella calospora MUT 4182]
METSREPQAGTPGSLDNCAIRTPFKSERSNDELLSTRISLICSMRNTLIQRLANDTSQKHAYAV